MKVILQQTVQKLGKPGDVVEASDGYFRNFLQPRKLAIVATTGTLKKREEDLEVIRKKAEATHKQLLALAEKIKELGSIRVDAKAGENGKLYGKVTTKDIAQQLSKALDTTIDKKDLRGGDDINALGPYTIVVKLASDIQAEINVDVAQEGSPIIVKKAAAPAAAEAEAEATDEPAEEEEGAELEESAK